MAGENEVCEEIGSVLLCTEPVFETPLVMIPFLILYEPVILLSRVA